MTTPAPAPSPPTVAIPSAPAPLDVAPLTGVPTADGPAPDPLAALRGIHPPPDVPLWPLAPGWWGLLGLLALVLVILAIREWRWRQTLAYKAMKEFEASLAASGAGDAQSVATAAAHVLRRLVRAQGGDTAAALTEVAWTKTLAAGRKGLRPEDAAFLARAPYLPPGTASVPGLTPARLAAAVRRWIRARA